MTWLEDIINQHKELESPISFWKWSALAALSAILRDNVWIDRAGVYKLYPNIYVMLHAESGLKKGPPVSMAKRLVNAVNNTTVISGRSSIQGILKQMGTFETRPGGVIDQKSSTFICSSELSSSIVDDPVATTILTDLYDRNYNEGNWKSLLKMEAFTLKDPTITMLTATNESHSNEFFDSKDHHGGFFARTFIIYESKRNVINALVDVLEHPPNYNESAKYLIELTKLRGEIKLDVPAKNYYKEWYHDFVNMTDTMAEKDNTGTMNRFGDSVLKVALLLSLAENNELTITKKQIEKAVSECEIFIGNARRTTLGKGKNPFGSQQTILILELLMRDPHVITQQQLNKKYWPYASSTEWQEITKSMEVAGIIDISMMGQHVCYTMPSKQVEEWQNKMRGK